FNPLATVEMYNPTTNAWTIETSLPTARSYLAAVSGPCQTNTTHTCIYAIGGTANGTAPLTTTPVEMFDSSANPGTWTAVASLPTARFALGAASGPCQTNTTHACIYAIGGT